MTKVIAIANQKGGVGKTSTTVNLGAGLVRQGYAVLAIDFDPQANLTMALGFKSPDDMEYTVSNVLAKAMDEEPIDPSEGILTTAEGVDLMPSSIQLSRFELALVNEMKFIALLIALIALIALIFTVAFLAGRDSKPVDHSAPTPTETITTEVPTETTSSFDPNVTGIPDMTPDMTFDPWGTGSPDPTPSVTGPVVTNPPVVRTTPKPTSAPHTSPVYGQAFTLTILGTNIPVSIGVDNATLDKTPGWLETSAYPGEEGVCVIYGHRNRNHLQVLKDIDFGDTITVTLADGTVHNYTVESIRILDPNEELRVPFISDQHIMLTTCYPFYYTGHAPQKFVIIASKS